MYEIKLIKCIKDVVMDDTGKVTFTKDDIYRADFRGPWIEASNDFNEDHCLGTLTDEDQFFQEHFIIL